MATTAEPCHLVAVGADVTACGLTNAWDRALNYSSALRLVTCKTCRRLQDSWDSLPEAGDSGLAK